MMVLISFLEWSLKSKRWSFALCLKSFVSLNPSTLVHVAFCLSIHNEVLSILHAYVLNNITISFRKVVEHICLLKANKYLSYDQEKDMLDYLYTSQYQMRGIVAVSLG